MIRLKRLGLVLSGLLLTTLVVWVLIGRALASDESAVIKVKIGDNGFLPAKVEIKQGQTVEWESEGSNQHWPASNGHPLHTDYPESGGCIGSALDACRSLSKGQTFKFKFNKAGKWEMHDHLYPRFGMEVDVLQKSGDGKVSWLTKGAASIYDKALIALGLRPYGVRAGSLGLFSSSQIKAMAQINASVTPNEAAQISNSMCSKLGSSKFHDSFQCYAEVIYVITTRVSSVTAFQTIDALQSYDKSTETCHLLAHGVGWAEYDKNPENWRNSIANANPKCSYGEIHGILEGYSSSGQGSLADKAIIPTICGDSPKLSCFHSVGHLLLVETKNNIGQAIDLCAVFTSLDRKQNCLSGVFMEHFIPLNLNQHGLVDDTRKNDWYTFMPEFEQLCRSQTGDPAVACWRELMHPATVKYNEDPRQVLAFCDTAQNHEAANACRRHASDYIIGVKNYDLKGYQFMCDLGPAYDLTFKRDCYMGFVVNAVSSLPSDRLGRIVNFCSGLDVEYGRNCFGALNRSLAELPDAANQITSTCRYAPSEYYWRICTGQSSGNSVPVAQEVDGAQ